MCSSALSWRASYIHNFCALSYPNYWFCWFCSGLCLKYPRSLARERVGRTTPLCTPELPTCKEGERGNFHVDQITFPYLLTKKQSLLASTQYTKLSLHNIHKTHILATQFWLSSSTFLKSSLWQFSVTIVIILNPKKLTKSILNLKLTKLEHKTDQVK